MITHLVPNTSCISASNMSSVSSRLFPEVLIVSRILVALCVMSRILINFTTSGARASRARSGLAWPSRLPTNSSEAGQVPNVLCDLVTKVSSYLIHVDLCVFYSVVQNRGVECIAFHLLRPRLVHETNRPHVST